MAGLIIKPALIARNLKGELHNKIKKPSINDGYILSWWAFRDSNPGPTGYEPVALTN